MSRSFLALTFLALFALAAHATSQRAAVQLLGPYPDLMTTLKVIDDAAATRNRAETYDRSGSFSQEIAEYDGFIGRWQNSAGNNEAAWSNLAGAHVQAARARALYAAADPAFQRNLTLLEQNRALVNQNIGAAYQDASNAEAAIRSSITMAADTKQATTCDVYKIRATAAALQGIVDRSARYIDAGIGWYKQTLECDPNSARETMKTISRLNATVREITNSPLSADNIAQMVSAFFKAAVPHGNLISYLVDQGYRLYKQRQPSPLQALPH